MNLKKLNWIATLVVVLTLMVPWAAFADVVVPDGDTVYPGHPGTLGDQDKVNLGTVAPGAVITTQISFYLSCQQKNHVDQGQSVSVKFNSSGSTVPAAAGAALDATDASIGPIPASWADDGSNCGSLTTWADNGNSTVTITAPTKFIAGQTYIYLVDFNANVSPAGNGDPQAITGDVQVQFQLQVAGDTTPPTLNLPASITAEATSASGATVTYTATADDTDPEHPAVTCLPASGSTFPLGTTPVNCSATDAAGNSASGSFSVLVRDTTPPAITVIAPTAIEATGLGGAIVSYSASAHDAVSGDLTPTCDPLSGSTFPLGVSPVTCEATDGAGNKGSTTFNLTVQDTQAPVLALTNAEAEATGPEGAAVTYTATANDVVDGPVTPVCAPPSGSTFALGVTTVNCTATDAHSNTSSGSLTVTVKDTTAPLVTMPDSFSVEATGPGGAVATFAASASDAVSGAPDVTCAPASGSIFPLGATEVTCSATDDAGNKGSAKFTVTVVDTKPPTVTVPSSFSVEATGPNGAVVTFAASASDIVSGNVAVVCLPASGSTFDLGETTVNCSAEDGAQNTGTASFTVTVVDTIPPTITFVDRTPANGNDWNNGSVTVNWSCSDTVGVVAPEVSVTKSAEGSGQSATGTCEDTSGNTASDTQTGINIDLTAPTASASAAPGPNANGWNNTNVTVSFTGVDGLSGIDFCDASVVLNTDGAGQSAGGTCTDKAGNESLPASKTGINIDKTKPTVSLVGGPADGGAYYFNFVPAAPTCSASDALSGLDGACVVNGYSTALGAHTVTASASDKAGNSNSASASYTVLGWTLNGFFQPVDNNGVWNTVKGGSTVPLKFEIFAGSTELTNTSYVTGFTVKGVACPTTGLTTDDIEMTTTGGTSLRYDTTAGQFIQNWQTPKKPGVCYVVTMTTLDGSSLSANFKLK